MKISKKINSATNSCGIPAKPSTTIEEKEEVIESATYDSSAEQVNEDYIFRVMTKVDEELPDTFVTYKYDADKNLISCTSASPSQIAEYDVPAEDLSGMIDEDAEYILGAIDDFEIDDYTADDELVEDGRYEFIDTKIVLDSDGSTTDYTMYYDNVRDRYVFVFGDSEVYTPYDGEGYFDFECETEEEAREWFDAYVGPGENDYYDDTDFEWKW